ncbi:probable inactive patatin-like protein 9 [Impatiens glandulifera]|uniref:probable inactive patatin-like protein 9 n=1 Tax=Impatiens glandulifera TaxID=253017 RepID=UPI001FB18125|nr:probable inactive patatin-like protein 9 [Impatiens glandulifera]
MDLSKMIPEIFSKLEQKWLDHHCHVKKTRILTIDGGETTGSVSGSSLIYLEDQIQSITSDPNIRIIDFFDIIAGTGIGGLYATLLAADDGTGRPLFTAKEAVNFVKEKQSDLYRVKTSNPFRRRRRFSGKSMTKLLAGVLTTKNGELMTLKNTCKPILIPCFDLNSSAPFVFSRADASQSRSYDFHLWKVIRATLAAPSLFNPFPLTSVDGKTSCLAVDGGIVMNNPTSAAVTHVLHNKCDFPSVNGFDDLLVLSLGNGSSIRNNHVNHSRRCLTSAIVNIAVDGVSETVDQMIANSFCFNRPDYVRIQAYEEKRIHGDVLTEKGVETLPFGGKKLLTETNGERIGTFVQRLTDSLPPSPCKEKAVTVNAVINCR